MDGFNCISGEQYDPNIHGEAFGVDIKDCNLEEAIEFIEGVSSFFKSQDKIQMAKKSVRGILKDDLNSRVDVSLVGLDSGKVKCVVTKSK